MYWILRKDQLNELDIKSLISSYKRTTPKSKYLDALIFSDELFKDVSVESKNFRHKLQAMNNVVAFPFQQHMGEQIKLNGKTYTVTVLDMHEEWVGLSHEEWGPVIDLVQDLGSNKDAAHGLTNLAGVDNLGKETIIISLLYNGNSNREVLQGIYPHTDILREFNVNLSNVNKEMFTLERMILNSYMKTLRADSIEFADKLVRLKNVSADVYTFCNEAYGERMLNRIVTEALIRDDKFYMLLGKYRVIASEEQMISYLLSKAALDKPVDRPVYEGQSDSRVYVRSSSRPEERGMEQYIEVQKEEPVYFTSSSRSYNKLANDSGKDSDSKLDAKLDRQIQRKLQEKENKQYDFNDLAPKQSTSNNKPQKKGGLMGGFLDLLKTNFSNKEPEVHEVAGGKPPVARENTVSTSSASKASQASIKSFKPNISDSHGQIYLGGEHQNANIVLPNGVEKLVVNGCTRLNGLYVNSNARVPVKSSTNRLVVNHLILGEKATEFLQTNNTMMLYPLKVTSQVPMKLTGRQVWDLLCFMTVFNSEIIQNEARYFVGDGVGKKPWEYPYVTDRRELKEVYAAEFILHGNTDGKRVLNAIKQRYQITFDTEYCGKEFRKYWDKQLTEKSIRKDLGFVDDKDKHSYHSTAYKYFINAVTKLVSYYNLWGIS